MPRNKTAHQNVISRRRESVAKLAARCCNIREIERLLPSMDPPCVKPDGSHWSRPTIGRDMIALRKRWMRDAARSIAKHQAEQLGLLREAEKVAWAKSDIDLVLKCHDRISKLLGTDAPDRIQHMGDSANPIALIMPPRPDTDTGDGERGGDAGDDG